MLMLLNTVVGVCSSESDEEAFVSRFIMNLEIIIFQMSLRLFFIESRLLLLLKKYLYYHRAWADFPQICQLSIITCSVL